MKTKIQYSVELQDIPKELKIKLSSLVDNLSSAMRYVDALNQDLEQESITIISARIDRVRRQLFNIDTGLEDCEKALRAYSDTVTRLQQEQAAQQAAQQAAVAPPQEAGEDA